MTMAVAIMDLTSGQDVVESAESTVASSSSSSSSAAASSSTTEKEKRLWGGSKNNHANEDSLASVQESFATVGQGDEHGEAKEKAKDEHAIPFVFKLGSSNPQQQKHTNDDNNVNIRHQPPQGFQITSRVYTDPKDKLAHFDNDSAMVFPYWECGVAGSTTVPIPLQHASVRHLLGGSQPTTYSGSEFGPYPQLVVALSPVDIVLNSGQVQTFSAGDVILLEDVVSCGHKLRGHDHQDMTVMILTLTVQYHKVGKDKTSLQSILTKDNLMKISPCPDGLYFSRVDVEASAGLGKQAGRILRNLQPQRIRRYILGIVGLSVSAVLGDFMGKVAPLWLAVLFGGGCFVTGGTVAIVKVGDKALDEFEMWQERRQLRLQGPEEVETDDEYRETNEAKMMDDMNRRPPEGEHRSFLDGEAANLSR